MPKVVVTEEQWIRLGVDYFSVGGEEALVIEKMAKQLKCSKSSFYWYFSNRESFIQKIIGYWQERATEQVIATVEKNESVDEKIKILLTTMFSRRQDNDLQFYLRRLGQRDNSYKNVLLTIEEKRINYFVELLQSKGFTEQLAREKSELIYYYYLGWFERTKYDQLNDREVERQVALIYSHIIH